MIRIGIPYLTEMSRSNPIPFISTGKSQKVEQDQKTTFFGDFMVALPVIWVATRPRDIESGLVFDHKPAWSGNSPLGYVLGSALGGGNVLNIETIIIISSIWLASLLIIVINRKILQLIAGLLVESIQDLKSQLEEAIAFISEGAIGDFEPPNPIVGMLANVIQQKFDQAPIEATVLRADDGKFKKVE